MTEKKPDLTNIASIRSGANHLDLVDHELDLQAVTSQPLSLGHVAGDLTNEQKLFALKRFHHDGLQNLDDLPVGVTFLLEKLASLSLDEAYEVLNEYLVEHDGDVNVPEAEYEFIELLVATKNGATVRRALDGQFAKTDSDLAEKHNFSEDIRSSRSSLEANTAGELEVWDHDFQVRLEATLIAYHSPYPEVRAVTDPYDDPNIPCETVRVYINGLIWTVIGTFINTFFSNRMPHIKFGGAVGQLFIYPTGTILAYILPKWKVKLFGVNFDLNPGPWTHKEQMLTTLFFVVAGSGTSYAFYNINVQRLEVFYDNKWVDFGYELLLILCTNYMGFGIAGVFRRFAVYPVVAMWPTLLPTIALNRALTAPERKELINGWKISRYNFFWIVAGASFIYFWIPNYLFTALSTFNWITWIKPDNYNLATITGSQTGLGLNPWTTFDWNVIDFISPLAVPFYSQVTGYAGLLLSFFIIIGLYWSNYKWTAYLPINSNALFTNTGQRYQTSIILNEHGLFDQKKYEAYGPPFYSAANLVVYGAFSALYPFAATYEIASRYQQIIKAFKKLLTLNNFKTSTFLGYNDPHSKMMSRYKEVPEWAFTIVLVISIVLAILCVKVYPAETPVWTIFFAVAINFVFLIPITAIYSVTGFSFSLNVLVELIIGYALPGNPLALNFVKALGTNLDAQAENFLTNQKLGHYSKCPQRSMFRVEMLAVFVSSLITLAVIEFQINNIEDYCLPGQPQKFTCPGLWTFYSASVFWGVIGPKKVFSGLYPILKYSFLIGFLLAFPCLAFKYYGPKKLRRLFQPTVFIGGMIGFAPYNLSYSTTGMYFAWASMYYLKRRFASWWEKYNYVFSAAMNAGIAFSGIIIFFAVQYHDKNISWWGNNVNDLGYDAMALPRLNATLSAPGGYFGPRKGHFP